jgi:ankyrin repeat protein
MDIIIYLLTKGVDVNASTRIGRTSLAKSCWNGQSHIVKLLLDQPGIDIEAKDNQGRTALHMAVWGLFGGRAKKKVSINSRDSPECARLLLEAGANPNSEDMYNVTPLATAVGTGGADCIDLLINYGADINHQDCEQTTPLHAAFLRGNIECLKQLMKHKPDTSILGWPTASRVKNGK